MSRNSEIFDEGLGRDLAGDTHVLDRGGVLDVALTEAGRPAADVFGAGDAGRDVALRGNPAGVEGSRHDLKF